jgi:CBS domain containing-hemolysin-like protein
MGFTEYLLKQSPSFIVMGILLLMSGFFSCSETALFSLTRYDRQRLNNLSGRINALVSALLRRPEQLLLVILFSNLAVNVSFYTISSVLIYRAFEADLHLLASGLGVASLLSLVFFGEILPKALAFNLRIPAVTVVVGPLWLVYRVLQPPMAVIHAVLILPAVRLFIGSKREAEPTREELLALLKVSHREGYLQTSQLDLLSKVINLRDLQVRQVMIPRVQMTACDIHIPVENAKLLVRKTSQTRLPVYVFQIDTIVGIVRARRLWTDKPKHLKDVLERVHFVPEFQRVDQLLHFFQTKNADLAIVVDEYGGVVGMVSREVVLEQLVEELSPEFSETPSPEIIRIGPGHYIADGPLPIREFFDFFRVTMPEEPGVDTLAGYMMHMKGHLPEENESLDIENLRLKVHTYHHKSLQKIEIIDQRKYYVE